MNRAGATGRTVSFDYTDVGASSVVLGTWVFIWNTQDCRESCKSRSLWQTISQNNKRLSNPFYTKVNEVLVHFWCWFKAGATANLQRTGFVPWTRVTSLHHCIRPCMSLFSSSIQSACLSTRLVRSALRACFFFLHTFSNKLECFSKGPFF